MIDVCRNDRGKGDEDVGNDRKSHKRLKLRESKTEVKKKYNYHGYFLKLATRQVWLENGHVYSF